MDSAQRGEREQCSSDQMDRRNVRMWSHENTFFRGVLSCPSYYKFSLDPIDLSYLSEFLSKYWTVGGSSFMINWRLAACQEFDTEDFYATHPYTQKVAQSICNGNAETPRCPIRDECREIGIRELEWGIWGGLTEADRLRLTGKKPRYTTSFTLRRSRAQRARQSQPEATETLALLA